MPLKNLPPLARLAAILLLAVVVGLADWRTGYYVSFSTFYAMPVFAAGWYLGTSAGLFTVFFTSLVWLISRNHMADAPDLATSLRVWNLMMKTSSHLLFYLGASGVRFRFETMRQRVRALTGLLPICNCCKRIEDESGYWGELETYLREHSEADVKRKLCPDCSKKLSARTGMQSALVTPGSASVA